MTWLDRTLASECLTCRRAAGETCATADQTGVKIRMFCASRIQAAEGAAKVTTRQHRHPWRYELEGASCWLCGTRRKSVGPSTYRYSTDSGATWTPGPSAYPGRRP